MTTINRTALHYSGAIGALMTVANMYQPHQRKHRACANVIKELERYAGNLGEVTDQDVEAGRQVFSMMNPTLEAMVKETGLDGIGIVAALCLFNVAELPAPLPLSMRERLAQFVACFPMVDEYETTRAGHRMWQRMESEIEILQAEVA